MEVILSWCYRLFYLGNVLTKFSVTLNVANRTELIVQVAVSSRLRERRSPWRSQAEMTSSFYSFARYIETRLPSSSRDIAIAFKRRQTCFCVQKCQNNCQKTTFKHIKTFYKVYDKTFTTLIRVLSPLVVRRMGPPKVGPIRRTTSGDKTRIRAVKISYHIPRASLCLTLWRKAPSHSCNNWPYLTPTHFA